MPTHGQSVLIRGGTSSVGLAAAALATWRGATVLSAARRAGRLALLAERGVDYPLLDTGEVAPAVRDLFPDSMNTALDLVGTPTLPDTLRAVRVHGTACFGGSLSNQWTVQDFSPNEYLPKGVRLAGYFGDAADLPREAFQDILDAIAAGRLAFPADRVYDGLEQVPHSPRRGQRPRHRQTRRPACCTAFIRQLRLRQPRQAAENPGARRAYRGLFERDMPRRRPAPGARGR